MTQYGLTPQGFRIKRLADIREEVEEDLRDTFGDDLILSDDSVTIQLVMPAMAQLSQVWESLENVYDSFDPDKALGTALVNQARIVGLRGRIPASFSEGEVKVSGQPNTIIPEGTVVENANTEDRFETTEQGRIPSDGSDIIVPIRALEEGPIQASINSITEIVTPVDGFEAVTNDTDLAVGRFREKDSELRQRRENSLFIGGKSVDLSMRAELLETEGVTHARIYSNRTVEVDSRGLEPGYQAVLYPISSDPTYITRIAETLFRSQPAGIRSGGSQEIIVEDDEGQEQIVRFEFANEVGVDVDVDITHDRNYPVGGDDDVIAIISDVMESLGINQSVRFLQFASPIQLGVEGIISLDITFNGLSQVGIDFDEIAVASTINVNSTQA